MGLEGQGKQQYILIAEADHALCALLAPALEGRGFAVEMAGSAGDAMLRLGDRKCSLVVADVALEGDVRLLIDHIAALPAGRRPVVLILAANGEEARALDAEVVQVVLRKPLDVVQAVDLISSCLRTAAGDETRRGRIAARDHATS